MTSEEKRRKGKETEKRREITREGERERVVTTSTTRPFIARQGVACLAAIRSFLVWWTLIFARFLSRYAATITYPPYFLSLGHLSSCENGTGRYMERRRGRFLLPRLGSIHHHHVQVRKKRSCLFQVRGRYLLRQLQRPSTSVWGFTWRAPLCVDLFIKNQNVREDGVRREKRRYKEGGGERRRRKKEYGRIDGHEGNLSNCRRCFSTHAILHESRVLCVLFPYTRGGKTERERERESCSCLVQLQTGGTRLRVISRLIRSCVE